MSATPTTPTTDPNEHQAIELFFAWDAQPADPLPYAPQQYSDEPWRSHAASAWILGRKLAAIDFEQYALSQFVLNCGLADLETWESIEKDVTESDSPLRRFADHWVAWNHGLAGPGGVSEYAHLEAVKALGGVVTVDTRDPRTYDLEHWYEECGGDVNARCEHEPMVKQAAWDVRNRTERPPLEDWGREWELKQKTGKEADTKGSTK